jgi:phosphate uptake regulator
LDIGDVGIDNFIRRMDNNLKDMFSILSETITTNKKTGERTREIEDIDKDVTKFYFLIWRFMNLGVDNPAVQSSLKVSPSSLITRFWVAYNLEQIGDELKRIARICENMKNKKQLLNVFNLLNSSYDDSMKSFFNKEKDIAQNIIFKNDSLIKELDSLSKNREFGIVSEKLHQINASIYRNAKMMFYNL